jgi:purine nucleosidase
MKILFDTDPGVDDAMALLMLARDARAELVGITTVFGNAPTDITTRNALALCERFAIEVPVARGAGQALVKPRGEYPEMIHGQDGMGNTGIAPARHRRVEGTAAPQFIGEMARRHEGELVIVAVGPLTNLAQALQHDPQLAERVQRVVVMGGAFGTHGHSGNVSPVAEANIANDPHAADVVLTARWPVTVVGLDVTHEVLMHHAYLADLREHGGEEGRFVWDITRCYEDFYKARTGGGIFSHDPTAVACALAPQHFVPRAGAVRVVPEGIAAGQTIQAIAGRQFPATDWNGLPSQTVCVGVDSERVLAEFRACFVR